MIERPDAPATRRNRDAILAVLKDEFRDSSAVLEIGSGTGQHAVYFGDALPHLTWQTSDVAGNHPGILSWIGQASLDNVLAPLELDVLHGLAEAAAYDAVFSANTAHIMGIDAVNCMFRLVGDVLEPGGRFCLYGPFNVDGEFTSDSNRQFDQELRMRDPQMGIRDLRQLDRIAAEHGLYRARLFAMPANNHIAAWTGEAGGNGENS